MIFLELDFAIYKRLVGYPVDNQGRPQFDPDTGIPVNREVIGPPDLNPVERIYDAVSGTFSPLYPELPSYGIRIPQMRAPYRGQRGLTSKDPVTVPRTLSDRFEPNTFRQIPVFDENIMGRKYDDVWPCVTFRWRDVELGSTYIYHDPFGAPGSGSKQDPTSGAVTIVNDRGETVLTGFAENIVRPHPEPWNAIYAITAWSKDHIELELICNEIMKLFPGKGAVVVTFQDGTKHACDMMLQRVENLDDGRDGVLQTQGGEEQRGFVRSFIYQIEAYIDNTTNQFGIQGSPLASRSVIAIQERLIELNSLYLTLSQLETREHDFNLDELSEFTPGGIY